MIDENGNLNVPKTFVMLGGICVVAAFIWLSWMLFHQGSALTRIDERMKQQDIYSQRSAIEWDAPDHDRYAGNIRRDTGETEVRRDKSQDALAEKMEALEERIDALTIDVRDVSRLKDE